MDRTTLTLSLGSPSLPLPLAQTPEERLPPPEIIRGGGGQNLTRYVPPIRTPEAAASRPRAGSGSNGKTAGHSRGGSGSIGASTIGCDAPHSAGTPVSAIGDAGGRPRANSGGGAKLPAFGSKSASAIVNGVIGYHSNGLVSAPTSPRNGSPRNDSTPLSPRNGSAPTTPRRIVYKTPPWLGQLHALQPANGATPLPAAADGEMLARLRDETGLTGIYEGILAANGCTGAPLGPDDGAVCAYLIRGRDIREPFYLYTAETGPTGPDANRLYLRIETAGLEPSPLEGSPTCIHAGPARTNHQARVTVHRLSAAHAGAHEWLYAKGF